MRKPLWLLSINGLVLAAATYQAGQIRAGLSSNERGVLQSFPAQQFAANFPCTPVSKSQQQLLGEGMILQTVDEVSIHHMVGRVVKDAAGHAVTAFAVFTAPQTYPSTATARLALLRQNLADQNLPASVKVTSASFADTPAINQLQAA